MKYFPLLLTLLLLTPTLVQAQKQQLIEVEGQSEIKVMPNQALINVNIQKKALKASEASQKLNQTSSQIIERLKDENIPSYEVTASNYMVNVNRIYGKGTSQDSGYVATQTLVVRVSDIEKSLLQVMEVLATFPALNYNMGFQLSDEMRKSKQEELLVKAIEDAKQKATLIASTLGLGDITVNHVTYPWQQHSFPGPNMMIRGNAQFNEALVDPTFMPEEQTLSDKILVSFKF